MACQDVNEDVKLYNNANLSQNNNVEKQSIQSPVRYTCETCGRGFAHRSGLSHHRTTHLQSRPFVCPLCFKGFRQRSGLAHHKHTHTTEKTRRCEHCGKTFAQGSGLAHHRATHSHVKKYQCTLCGKAFAQGSGMAHHRKIHLKQTNIQMPQFQMQTYGMSMVKIQDNSLPSNQVPQNNPS